MKSLDEILKANTMTDLRIHWCEELQCFTASIWTVGEGDVDHLEVSGNADTFGGALVRIHKLANKL
jgi:hypothetical protein